MAAQEISPKEARDIINAHGLPYYEFSFDRRTARTGRAITPERQWAVGCEWIKGPLTRSMVYAWLGY